jgi:hypothetical protein
MRPPFLLQNTLLADRNSNGYLEDTISKKNRDFRLKIECQNRHSILKVVSGGPVDDLYCFLMY